jgi:hypothetical protein
LGFKKSIINCAPTYWGLAENAPFFTNESTSTQNLPNAQPWLENWLLMVWFDCYLCYCFIICIKLLLRAPLKSSPLLGQNDCITCCGSQPDCRWHGNVPVYRESHNIEEATFNSLHKRAPNSL